MYNINKNEIQLFGKDFVKNNKDNFNLIIEGRKNGLCQKLKLDKK